MLEELAEVGAGLAVRRGEPPLLVAAVAAEAALVYTDVGYLRIQQLWSSAAAERCPRRMEAVEDEVVVPTAVPPPREEWAARTLRPRIMRNLDRFLTSERDAWPRRDSLAVGVAGTAVDPSDLRTATEGLGLDPADGGTISLRLRGGAGEARRPLRTFVEVRLSRCHLDRRDPGLGCRSEPSPYLHFG